MRILDLIEELPDIIASRFDVLDSAYKEDEAFEAAHAFGEHLALSYEVRFVLINGETGQLDSTMLYEDQEEAEKAAGDRCLVGTLLVESLESAPAKPVPTDDLLREAHDAFWEVVAKRFPVAKTGDLSPECTLAFGNAARAAVEEWVRANVPHKPTGGAA